MKLHSFESFGAVDGPGVRFVAFLSGCPFRCAYCHNPDTWARPAAFEATPEEVFAKALRYRPYWGRDGGITASGGEPMMQAKEVAKLFHLAHETGATTCLDTAAASFSRNDKDVVRLLAESDTVILDIKAFGVELHRQLTGSGNARVLDCARYLDEIGKKAWIRRVIVPGLTDGEEDLKLTGEFIRGLSNVERVDVLPYHALGVAKWQALGLEYGLSGVRPPTDEDMRRAKAVLDGLSAI